MESITWMKAKYSSPKQRGRYSGGTHNGPPKHRKKVSGSKPKPVIQRIMVLNTNNKISWDWREVA